MTDNGGRILLKVIRRQPMIFWANECLEEGPSFSRQRVKESSLSGTKTRSTGSPWLADPPHPERREEPKAQYGYSLPERTWSCERQIDCQRCSNGRADPHGPAQRNDARAAITVKTIRRIPFQKPFVCDEHSNVCSRNGTEAEKGFVGKTGERKYSLLQAAGRRTRRRHQVLAQRNVVRLPKDIQAGRKQSGGQDDSDDRQSPRPESRQDGPSQQQEKCECCRYKASPQIVENLPSRQHRKRIRLGASGGVWNARQQPLCNLPVSANPAAPAAHVSTVMRWVFLVQQHVAEQPSARVASLEKIVT